MAIPSSRRLVSEKESFKWWSLLGVSAQNCLSELSHEADNPTGDTELDTVFTINDNR
jgi:hypothetical protein